MSIEVKSNTANRAQVSDTNRLIIASSVTDVELGYLSGALSNVQTQLNGKAASVHTHVKADITDFSHTHVKANITDFAHTHQMVDISDIPSPIAGMYLHRKADNTGYEWVTASGGTGLTDNSVKMNHLYSYESDTTAEVSILWMIMKNEALFVDDKILTKNAYTDRAVYCRGAAQPGVSVGVAVCLARNSLDGINNTTETTYFNNIGPAATNSDHTVYKIVNGTTTLLGTEAVDLVAGGHYPLKLSCSGTTIKGYRGDFSSHDVDAIAKLTVTDSAISSGKYGVDNLYRMYINATGANAYLAALGFTAKLMPAGSPSRVPVSYHEVDIIGSGTKQDPFRADVKHGLDYSAVIKTGSDGKPTNYTAIVRVFNGDLQEKRIEKDAAIKRAKQLDDLLQDWDFITHKDASALKDCQAFRRSNMKVEQSDVEIAHILTDAKGW